MTEREPGPRRRRSLHLVALLMLQLPLIGALAYATYGLRSDLLRSRQHGEQGLELVLGTYTLRQSSDYLTRFARRYAVTGDPVWRDVYQQVLDIRRGDALRPKDNESVYWDLIEPYRSNAHPLLYPQSLRSILSGLPFTSEELALLQRAEDDSDALARVEETAFRAVQEGRREDAIEALFSVDYLRAKHAIMQPIDELMVRVRERIEQERDATLALADRYMYLVLAVAALTLLADALVLHGVLRRERRSGSRGERGNLQSEIA